MYFIHICTILIRTGHISATVSVLIISVMGVIWARTN